jgi:hypothetical protein
LLLVYCMPACCCWVVVMAIAVKIDWAASTAP